MICGVTINRAGDRCDLYIDGVSTTLPTDTLVRWLAGILTLGTDTPRPVELPSDAVLTDEHAVALLGDIVNRMSYTMYPEYLTWDTSGSHDFFILAQHTPLPYDILAHVTSRPCDRFPDDPGLVLDAMTHPVIDRDHAAFFIPALEYALAHNDDPDYLYTPTAIPAVLDPDGIYASLLPHHIRAAFTVEMVLS